MHIGSQKYGFFVVVVVWVFRLMTDLPSLGTRQHDYRPEQQNFHVVGSLALLYSETNENSTPLSFLTD